MRPCILALVCVGTCVTLIYTLGICEAIGANLDKELLLPLIGTDSQTIVSGPRVCKNVHKELISL